MNQELIQRNDIEQICFVDEHGQSMIRETCNGEIIDLREIMPLAGG